MRAAPKTRVGEDGEAYRVASEFLDSRLPMKSGVGHRFKVAPNTSLRVPNLNKVVGGNTLSLVPWHCSWPSLGGDGGDMPGLLLDGGEA